ncbi:hypothetical protein B0I35DRAFT_446206 [Stachybotrys elegans]|uniref:Uncharacterized protein n=1 Tax=Stachybotrys elegans TaxID=80388 RepID=A0A8K0SDI9_9HYPO|nr:hypothetical protein B0I35DRAFT_446206 [Stachybotrys elegans]
MSHLQPSRSLKRNAGEPLQKQDDTKRLLRMEWLTQEITQSKPEVLDTFLALCQYISMIFLGDPGSLAAKALLERDSHEWLSRISRCDSSETDKTSLLRCAFEFAGGRADARQIQVSQERSASDNLRTFAKIFGIEAEHSCSPSTVDDDCIRNALLQSEGRTINKDIWRNPDIISKERISLFVPITPLEPRLPAVIVDNIGWGTLQSFKAIRKMPGAKHETKDDMYLFVCFCANSGEVQPAFGQWAMSTDGRNFRQLTIERIRENRKKEMALEVATVISLEMLDTALPDEARLPISRSLLQDYMDAVAHYHPAIQNILYRAAESVCWHPSDQVSEELDPLEAHNKTECIRNEGLPLNFGGSPEPMMDEWVEVEVEEDVDVAVELVSLHLNVEAEPRERLENHHDEFDLPTNSRNDGWEIVNA